MGVESMGRRPAEQPGQAASPGVVLPPLQLPIVVVVDQESLTTLGQQLRETIVAAVAGGMQASLDLLGSEEDAPAPPAAPGADLQSRADVLWRWRMERPL